MSDKDIRQIDIEKFIQLLGGYVNAFGYIAISVDRFNEIMGEATK